MQQQQQQDHNKKLGTVYSLSLSRSLSGSCTMSLSVSLWEKLEEQRRAGRA
jgi:hypothetical protein